MQIDDLVNFCAYYTLTKTGVKLPHAHLTATQEQPQEKQKQLKVTRKKFEVEPKKAERVGVGKAKMEYASKVSQKSVSPIHQSYPREPQEHKNSTYDINYFVSHLATETATNRSNWHEPRPREQQGYQTQGYQNHGYQQQGYQQQQPSRRQ